MPVEAALHIVYAHARNGRAVPALHQRFLDGQLGQPFLARNVDAYKKAVRAVCAHKIGGGQGVDGYAVQKPGHQFALAAHFVDFFALHRAPGLWCAHGQVTQHDVFGHGHHAHILERHGPQGRVGQQHAQGNAQRNLGYFIREGALRCFAPQAQPVQLKSA